MVLFGEGCCRFDSWVATNQNKQTIAECQKICKDDTNCIAFDADNPVGDKYDCHTFQGSGMNFHTECGSDEVCYRKTGSSKYQSK